MADFLSSIPRRDAPEDDLLMETLQDILDNGGRIPPDVGNALVLAAVRTTYRAVQRGGNTSRHNQLHLWALSVLLVGAIAGAVWLRSVDVAVLHAAFPYLQFIAIP